MEIQIEIYYKHAKKREKNTKYTTKKKVQKFKNNLFFFQDGCFGFFFQLVIISIHEPTTNPVAVFKVNLLFIVIELFVKFQYTVNLDSDVRGHTNNFFFSLYKTCHALLKDTFMPLVFGCVLGWK